MLNISHTVLDRFTVWKNTKAESGFSHKMEVHLVNRADVFYKKGRNLASQVYKKTWGTNKLIDDNNYAIVVTNNHKVVGNLNLEVKENQELLKSEKFFGKGHWLNCAEVPDTSVVEISGLSIAKDVPSEMRQPILMILMFAKYTLIRSLGKTFGVSIQRKALHRILTKHLHLPFFLNPQVEEFQGEVPQDAYWRSGEKPRLYYIDYTNTETVETMNSYLFYLSSIGISTEFISRFHPQPTSYAKFRRQSRFNLAAV